MGMSTHIVGFRSRDGVTDRLKELAKEQKKELNKEKLFKLRYTDKKILKYIAKEFNVCSEHVRKELLRYKDE